jgi:hypothetical protein
LTTNDTIDKRSASRLPRIWMLGSWRPGGDGAAQQPLLLGADRLDADGRLELEDQPGADRLDDRGRAASSRCAGSAR